MTDTQALFGALRNSADPEVVDAIETLVRDGEDRALSRINILKFAGERKLDEEKTISGFLHASRLGLFELNWNVLCPGCGGVLNSSQQLKSVHKEAYDCALCSRAYEPTLDEMVEVAFTVSPRVRRIAAHDPHLLPVWEYFRQTFWGSGIDLPEENFVEQMEEFTIDAMEIGPGEKAQLSLTLPADFVILFEPVTHFAHFIDVKGEPTKERQNSGADLQQGAFADGHHGNAAGPAAHRHGEQQRRAGAADGLGRRASSSRSARQAAAVPDRASGSSPTRPSATSIAPTRSTSIRG